MERWELTESEIGAVVYCPICGNSTNITKGERIHFGIPRVIYCTNRGINSICKVSYVD